MKSHRRDAFATPVVWQCLIGVMLLLIGELAMAQVSAKTALAQHTPKAVLNNTVELVGRYAPEQMVRLVYGLHTPHAAEEEQFLRELQTQGSPQYHKFLTADEWNARFAPSAQDEQAVVDWAQSQGLTVAHRYPNRMLVDVEAPVAAIEKAHDITINSYRAGSTAFFSNDRDPAIPANLKGIVRSVGGLNNLEVMHPGRGAKVPVFSAYVAGPVIATGATGGHSSNGSKPVRGLADVTRSGPTAGMTNGAYDPTDMFSSQAYNANALYALGHCCNPLHNPGVTPPETSIAIATAGTQDPNDFTGFHNQYPYLADHWQQFFIDGTPPCCDGEGTMDMEWATAMSNSFGAAADTAMVYMYNGANSHLSTFTDIYNRMLTDGRARIMSTSWGCAEFDCATQAIMDTQHAIFNAMVGQGWTLVGISHDGGTTTSCLNHNAVSYPGSDPNFVSAGGTRLFLSAGPVYNSEVAWTAGPFGCAQNDGGTGGGISFYYPAPPYQGLPDGFARQVPDIALNADWVNTPQNIFVNGSLSGNGGTSIVAPEVAGFFANVNAYLLYLSTVTGGLCNGHACAPLGNANYPLYWFGQNPGFASHYPYYDITVGCNNNDITASLGLGFYCAGAGHDMVTGWGSFNMLQLAWAINKYQTGASSLIPFVRFTGPTLGRWYNTNQVVSWTVSNTTGPGQVFTGVAGYRSGWALDPGDAFSEPTPGSGNSFYSGPQFPNATSGCLDFTGASCPGGGIGQGWHTAHVRAWDNTGVSSLYTYGGLGFDSIPPQTKASVSGSASPVQVKLTATDNASGVASTVYQLDGGSVQTYTGPFTVASVGAHVVTFHSADVAGNVEATGSIGWTEKLATSTAVVSSKNPSPYLSPVTFTASVTSSSPGTLSGTVTFKNGSATLGTGTVSNGKATFTTSTLTAGAHSITAIYAGSAVFAGSTSSALTQTVTHDATSSAVASSKNPSVFGAAVTFTATVKSTTTGTPTGTITFKNGSVTLGTGTLSAGKASLTTATLTAGAHAITAVYGGDANFTGSASAVLTQTVTHDAASSTVASSKNPSVYGSAVTFTATVKSTTTGTPTGTVTFKNGSVTLGTGTLSAGKASLTTATLTAGAHAITAVYGGDANFTGSASAVLTQTVTHDAASSTVASSKNPSVYGSAVTFTATVKSTTTGTPTGTVTFKSGSVTLGIGTLSAGKASLTTATLTAGADSISAVYGGDANFSSSTSAVLTQTVTKAASTSSVASSMNPAVLGTAMTFTATVKSATSGVPTGTVTFKEGTTTLGTGTLSAGVAKFSTSSLTAGTHAITAVYGGNANFNTSTSVALTQTISP